MSNPSRLTTEEITVRVWAVVVLSVIVIFAGITIAMLYSVIFVVQPIKTMAPIDQAFVKMLNDIVLLIVGGIGGIMGTKGVDAIQRHAQAAATPQNAPTPPTGAFGALPVFVNPPLDESWTPGPPPTTPPDHLHPEREEIAQERESAKTE